MKRPGLALVSVLLLSACGVAAPDPAPTVTVTATPDPSPTASPSTPAAPTAPPAEPSGRVPGSTLGLGFVSSTPYVSMTVLGYDPDATDVLRSISVRTCVDALPEDVADGLAFSWSSWNLIAPDGSAQVPSDARPTDHGPLYPDANTTRIPVGQCVTGAVFFERTVPEPTLARFVQDPAVTTSWSLAG